MNKKKIDLFNEFLVWGNIKKNKAIYSLFSKAIEFAILTSGRGISTISNDIFTNKTYYLDTNVIIRALGVDGEERKASILSVLESCNHDGIKFKIGKCTSDELYGIVNKRSLDIKKKTNSESEVILSAIIEDLPLNNSFETDYLKKRKEGKVKSPNNYRLTLEQELEKFIEKFSLQVEVIKNLPHYQITQLQNQLYNAKKNEYGIRYSMGAALVDARNVLHVRNIRDLNNYNYKDIKSFYLTTDGTLNEIIGNDNPEAVSETILPSQLFVIHNSFHKTTTNQDYNDFIKFIKLRKTDFKLPGSEVFNYLEQIRSVTSNPEDIKASLRAYANYRFQNKDKFKDRVETIVPIKEFTTSLLEKELDERRNDSEKLQNSKRQAIHKLPNQFKLAIRIAYGLELVLLLIAAFFLRILNSSTTVTVYIIIGLVLYLLLLFALKDKFGFHKYIRNWSFDRLAKSSSYYKVYPNDDKFLERIKEIKNS